MLSPPPPQHSVRSKVSIPSPLPPASEAKPESIQSVQSAIFHLFPFLPAEIRLKIWSLLSPRTITFLPDGAPPPAILSVCREARAETLSRYTRENLRPRRSNILLEEERGVAFINYELDVLNISSFQIPSIKDNVVQLFLLAQTTYPAYLQKLQRIMVGVPVEFRGMLGFEDWWHFTPWKLIDTACGKCREVIFVFGGDEGTRMEDLVDMKEARRISWDEEKSMAMVRESLQKAGEEGYCVGLEVRFARDKKRLSGRVDLI